MAQENVRGVVTLTEDYETRFLCFSPQVSPGIAGVLPTPDASLVALCPGTSEASSRPLPVILAATAKSYGSKDGYSYLNRL